MQKLNPGEVVEAEIELLPIGLVFYPGEQLRLIQSRLLDGTRSRPGDPDEAALRAGLASSMLVGIVVGRRIVGVPILAGADSETLIERIAPAIHNILTAAQE